jgi:hypothetical protein
MIRDKTTEHNGISALMVWAYETGTLRRVVNVATLASNLRHDIGINAVWYLKSMRSAAVLRVVGVHVSNRHTKHSP